MRRFFKKIIDRQEVGVLLPLILLTGLATAINPVFVEWANLSIMLTRMSTWGLLAIGMTFIILIGEIDVSIGSMVSFGAMMFATLLQKLSMPLVPAIILVFVLTVSLSAVNAFCIVKLKLSAFITTIAMLNICKGAGRVLTDARPVSIFGLETTKGLTDFGNTEIQGLGIMFFLFIALVLIAQFVLTKTVYGRKVYATGDSKTVARLAGIRVDRIKISAFIISGFMVGLASIMTVARETVGNPNYGEGWELIVIAATCIGGISLVGGSGSMIGTLIGVTIIAAISNILILLNVNQHMQAILTGIILILSVLVDVRRRNKKLGKD